MSSFRMPFTSAVGIGSSRRVLTLCLAVIAGLFTACGDDNSGGRQAEALTGDAATTAVTTAARPPSAAPTATSPAATATATAPPAPTAPVPAPAGGGASAAPDDGGAEAVIPGGDERGNRVPAAFTVSAARVSPSSITVPPFLGIELRVTSGDGAAHTITLRTPVPVTIQIPASGTITQTIDGQKIGTYAVQVDGKAGAATLRVADDAGP